MRVSLLLDGSYRVSNVEAYAHKIIDAERRRSILRMLPEIEQLVAEGKSLEDVGSRLRIEADGLSLCARRKFVLTPRG